MYLITHTYQLSTSRKCAFFFQCDIVVSISKQQHAHQQCQWKFQCPGDCFYVGHHDIATTWAKQSTQVLSCFSQTLVPMQSMFFTASSTSSSFKSRFVMFDLHSLICHKYENPYSVFLLFWLSRIDWATLSLTQSQQLFSPERFPPAARLFP